MKYSLISTLLIASTILFSGAGYSKTVDWTPYVKDMANSCDDSKIMKLFYELKFDDNGKIISWGKFPKELRAGIAKVQPYHDDYYFILKDSVAFGYPLMKIFSGEIGDVQSTTLTFANDRFMSLLPTFNLSDGKRTQKIGTKHYWVNEVIRTKNPLSDDPYYHYQTLASHNMVYYANNADREMISAFVNERNTGTNYYDPTLKQQLSKNFYQYQQPLLNKFLKTNSSYKNSKKDYLIETYRTHATGYEINREDSYSVLDFNKKKKTLDCTKYFRGDMPSP